MLNNFLILQAVFPLITAPLCTIFNNKIAWRLAFLSSLINFIIAIILSVNLIYTGSFNYFLGGWKAPIGIEVRLDGLNILMLLLLSFIFLCVIIYAKSRLLHSLLHKTGQAYSLLLLC